MRPWKVLVGIFLALALGMALPAWARAEVVGHFTEVQGQVDLLKGGKLPATQVAVKAGVESGDVVRTKSLSKAQITFIDNSVITISPRSRLAIDEYVFDPAKKKRNAVLHMFRGMAHVVVNKLFKVKDPDFVVKTNTAVTGVRGTDFGIRLQPNSSTILNFEGVNQVANIFPEVGKLKHQADKLAYAFGPPGSPNSVILKDMQGTTVAMGLPPTLPFTISPEERDSFMKQMLGGLARLQKRRGTGTETAKAGGGQEGAGGGSSDVQYLSNLGGPDSGLGTPVSTTSTPAVPVIAPAGLTSGTGSTQVASLNTVTVPPTAPPPTDTSSTSSTSSSPSSTTPPTEPPVEPPVEPPPTPVTYSFTQTGFSSFQSTISSSGTSLTTTTTGAAQLTGDWPEGTFPEYYTSTGSGERAVVQGTASTPGTSTGTSLGSISGTVTGVEGENLTGTAVATGLTAFGQIYRYTGNVVIEPSGRMTFTYNDGTISSSRQIKSASGTIIYEPGTLFTQNLDGTLLFNSTTPYSSQTGTSTWSGGTSYMNGVLSYFNATLTGTDSSPWTYAYLTKQYSDLMGTSILGVVSPGGDGYLKGALYVMPGDQDLPFTSSLSPAFAYLPRVFDNWKDFLPIAGPVTIDPSGRLTGTVYITGAMDGKFGSATYDITQTPQATAVTAPANVAYEFNQTYNGSMFLGSYNGVQANFFGWGQRTGTLSDYNTEAPLASMYQGTMDGYFVGYSQGNWTVTSGNLQTPYSSAMAVTQMSGRVTGTLGQTLTGNNMEMFGSLLNGVSFSYSGPVTIESDGDLKFTYTGNWIGPDNSGGTASGVLRQDTGYHFTQTMSGTYQLNSDPYNPNNATLTLSGGSGSGSRVGVDPGTVNNFTGQFALSSPDMYFPTAEAGPADLQLEGVVGTSDGGAKFGAATLTSSLTLGETPFTVGVPGNVAISPGGTYFNIGGMFVQPMLGGPVVNVASGGPLTPSLAQLPMFNFTQSYQGFRVGLSESPFSLASVEGYGWGQRVSSNLPTNYTGYFIAQDLGTRAGPTGTLPTNMVSLTGNMSGTVSGNPGSTLSGQMTFTGTSNTGVQYNFGGNVALTPDGKLYYYYNGTWQAASTSGTGSGTMTQIPGTYFSENLSGDYQQSTTSSGPVNITATTDQLTGTRTVVESNPGVTTTPTTASMAVSQSSTTGASTPSSGSVDVAIEGVVVKDPTYNNKVGVASIAVSATPTGTETPVVRPTTTGPVTIDAAGQLTAQTVDQTNPANNLVRNVVSVPASSGLTTSSITQTVSGTFTQTANADQSGFNLTTPTPLTGTATGPINGPVNTNVAITSQASQPNSVGTVPSSTISVNTVAAVAGPPGGVQTGVSSTQVVKTINGTAYAPSYVGTAVVQPAAGSTPTTVTTTLNSKMNLPPNGASNTQTGTAVTTPKP